MSNTDCIDSAGRYIKKYGRKVDINLYMYYFEDGSKDSVLNALMEYQNSDDGFGHALEPDVRMEASSILATTVAFQLMRPLNLFPNHEIVQKGIHYFLDSFNNEKMGWEIVPSNVDDAPHAPWWKYDPEIQAQWANPRAEILGYLYEYQSITPSELRETLLDDILTRLNDSDSLEMHEVRCFVRLLESPNLPETAKKTIFSKLETILPDIMELNPDKWDEYCLRPLDVVSSPDSPLSRLLEDVIKTNIQYIVEKQHEDGDWSPAWSWDFVDAKAWEQALSDLRSNITLRNILKISVFSENLK
ncbi:MAG: hypothetical protein GY801_52190 [bacterium]|nr:hypothetical protein [bacterium]